MKFIVRVDDVGQDLDQAKPDRGLTMFRRWWDAGGWDGLPICLGVVPDSCGFDECKWLRENIKPPAEVALHGWNHANKELDYTDLSHAQVCFPSSKIVIPPYNRYSDVTVNAMESLGLTTLLGGFDGDHHRHGSAPKLLKGGKVLHVSAEPDLCARCYGLVSVLTDARWESPYPLQIILHHRWDVSANALDGVRRLRDLIAPCMVGVDGAWKWAKENQDEHAKGQA